MNVLPWFVLPTCLALSFLLSGMEAGVFALSRLRVRQQMRAGRSSAAVLHNLLEHPENFLWTILVGNTLVNFILLGWVIGCAIAIPLGLVAGRSALVRAIFDPYVEFFRFIPPIAFITLFLIWFGLGETSKILLIVYTTMFVTFLNTMTGAMSVEPEKIRAARCMGATPRQTFVHVVVPATVPHIVTGLRLAMGNAFMTVVAAELVAAQSGVGHLIWNSRLFAQTDFVFVGIITLGLMGFTANWALKKIALRLAYRYNIQL